MNILLSNCKQILRHCHSWLARQYLCSLNVHNGQSYAYCINTYGTSIIVQQIKGQACFTFVLQYAQHASLQKYAWLMVLLPHASVQKATLIIHLVDVS